MKEHIADRVYPLRMAEGLSDVRRGARRNAKKGMTPKVYAHLRTDRTSTASPESRIARAERAAESQLQRQIREENERLSRRRREGGRSDDKAYEAMEGALGRRVRRRSKKKAIKPWLKVRIGGYLPEEGDIIEVAYIHDPGGKVKKSYLARAARTIMAELAGARKVFVIDTTRVTNPPNSQFSVLYNYDLTDYRPESKTNPSWADIKRGFSRTSKSARESAAYMKKKARLNARIMKASKAESKARADMDYLLKCMDRLHLQVEDLNPLGRDVVNSFQDSVRRAEADSAEAKKAYQLHTRTRSNPRNPEDVRGRHIPEKYLAGLPPHLRAQRIQELGDSRDEYGTGDFSELPTDRTARKMGLVKLSAYRQVAMARGFDISQVNSLGEMAKEALRYYGVKASAAQVSKLAAGLEKVYSKGLAAWKSGGHRPGASSRNWADARVASVLVGGKAAWTADKKQFNMLPAKARKAAIDQLPELYEALASQGRKNDIRYIQRSSGVVAQTNPMKMDPRILRLLKHEDPATVMQGVAIATTLGVPRQLILVSFRPEFYVDMAQRIPPSVDPLPNCSMAEEIAYEVKKRSPRGVNLHALGIKSLVQDECSPGWDLHIDDLLAMNDIPDLGDDGFAVAAVRYFDKVGIDIIPV